MDYFERSGVFVVAVEKELLTGDQIFFFFCYFFKSHFYGWVLFSDDGKAFKSFN